MEAISIIDGLAQVTRAIATLAAMTWGCAGAPTAGTAGGPHTGPDPGSGGNAEQPADDAHLAMETTELDGTWDVRPGNPALPELIAEIDGGRWRVRMNGRTGSSVAALRAEMAELGRIRLHAVGGWLALCATPGLYDWRRRGNVIELTVVEDDCTRRRGGLDGAEFTRRD
jgi:hypothetical protein